ncbi:unnamed protein product, partial [marine sediment metagenome]
LSKFQSNALGYFKLAKQAKTGKDFGFYQPGV